MDQENNFWNRQFVEFFKELHNAYKQFCINRNIEDYDKAYLIHEELNDRYKKDWSLTNYLNLGELVFAGKLSP